MKILSTLALLLFTSAALATDIQLTWDKPLEREDGTAIETIDRFNLYTTIDNVLQDVIEVSGDATGFQVLDVKAGNYTFQISTIEYGQEGALSDPVSLNIEEKTIAKAGKIRLTIEVIE